MGVPVFIPIPQFCDQNGKPYSGGTISTFVRGTTTPAATWQDPELTALNTNPVVLDASGRCVMWGNSDLQLQLNDASGNLIWSVPSTTFVSAAMLPVTTAPTIPDALIALGLTGSGGAISTAVAAEAATRAAADTSLTTAVNALSAALQTETTSREEADTDEAAARTAADAALQGQINTLSGTPHTYMQGGVATILPGAGFKTITLPSAFATSIDAVVVTLADATLYLSGINPIFAATIGSGTLDTTQFTVSVPGSTPPGVNVVFNWVCIGH